MGQVASRAAGRNGSPDDVVSRANASHW